MKSLFLAVLGTELSVFALSYVPSLSNLSVILETHRYMYPLENRAPSKAKCWNGCVLLCVCVAGLSPGVLAAPLSYFPAPSTSYWELNSGSCHVGFKPAVLLPQPSEAWATVPGLCADSSCEVGGTGGQKTGGGASLAGCSSRKNPHHPAWFSSVLCSLMCSGSFLWALRGHAPSSCHLTCQCCPEGLKSSVLPALILGLSAAEKAAALTLRSCPRAC